MLEEFAKLIVQLIELFEKRKFKGDKLSHDLYKLYSDISVVIRDSAQLLDIVERLSVRLNDESIREMVYDSLVKLGQSTEELARNMANIYGLRARFSLGDTFADELTNMLGLKCERLFFWANLFSNPNLRIQRKLVWLTLKASKHLQPELPLDRVWMAPMQHAEGDWQELRLLADRSSLFDFHELDIREARESDLMDLAYAGRLWVARMRNCRAVLARYLRENFPMDNIWPI